MKRNLSKVAWPVLTAIAYPIAMLAFPSATTVRLLWIAAILTFATQAGIALSKHISKKQAIALASVAVVGLAVAWLVGWIRFDDTVLEHLLGDIALVIVALALPLQALIARLRNEVRPDDRTGI